MLESLKQLDGVESILPEVQPPVAEVESAVTELASEITELESEATKLESEIAEVQSLLAEVQSTLAEVESAAAEEGPAEEISEEPQHGPGLTYLLKTWKSHHGYPAPEETEGALSKFILEAMLSGKGYVHIFKEGAELIKQGWAAPIQQHRGDATAQHEDSTGMGGRRGPARPPPLDESTRRMLKKVTALSPEGKTAGQDMEEALISPPFPDSTPGAQDASAGQQADGPTPPTVASKPSEPDSASTLLAPSENGSAARDPSTGPSTSASLVDVSANEKDEFSGDQHIEEPSQSAG